MKEWNLYMKKIGGIKKEYLGLVVADSPNKAIKLFFEPEDISLKKDDIIEIVDSSNKMHIFEFKNNRIYKKIAIRKNNL